MLTCRRLRRCVQKERKLAVFQGSRCSDQRPGTYSIGLAALLRLPTAHLRWPQSEDLPVKKDVLRLGAFHKLVEPVPSVCMVVSLCVSFPSTLVHPQPPGTIFSLRWFLCSLVILGSSPSSPTPGRLPRGAVSMSFRQSLLHVPWMNIFGEGHVSFDLDLSQRGTELLETGPGH